jgi:hypothetical protein
MTTTTTTAIRERVEGHYEVEEVPYGEVYKWTPGHALVECECGQLILVDATTTTCPCGADYTAVVQRLAGETLEEDKVYDPEQQDYEAWLREEEAHPELDYQLELQALS